MSKSDIERLLKKYPPHKKAQGEIWSKESETRAKQEYRLNQKYYTFDCMNNQHLQLTGESKARVKYLIQKVNWKTPFTEEQIIIMIMLYVKLKQGYYIQQYNYLLSKYALNYENFINFIIKLS